MIDVQSLTMTYRRRIQCGQRWGIPRYRWEMVHALHEVSFQCLPGTVTAYLGHNGAGKSTTIKALCGILRPTSGQVCVNGFVPSRREHDFLQSIGVMFGQRNQLMWELPLMDSLDVIRVQYGLNKGEFLDTLAELDSLFRFGEILHTPVRNLSLGQRMLGNLAATLLHRPRVLLLDEPTIGLDVESKASLRRVISAFRQKSCTILLATHDLQEAEMLADQILILDHGRLLFGGSIAEFRRLHRNSVVIQARLETPVSELDMADAELSQDGRIITIHTDPERVATRVAELLRMYRIRDLKIGETPLETLLREELKAFVSAD
ncbi:ABC transporter ATP-binding protein [Alicyclobacillus macrosporangiidus]|jgi:ABC-2 type transport system ATP-binding protein|uniref:ABC-2 type transport system ATP-binding protein n=1 Tax=Alicyclobacillus macrosporangiidus TaxID=392015 RepID=A0A1I7GAY6_9BACL|nr:ATP-binding cassette domain-containing protein [Alicyclobacillus macrosporangiidus]SFU45612.1 ABC-2 type transport system ATP-binding protein [Alicyclobacillus macrosporangiidus]